MYLVVIAWLYVVLMMAVAEAFSSQGSILGAGVTFVLYGVLPLGLVVYILNTPHRKARRLAEEALQTPGTPASASAASTAEPDAGGHATRGPQRSAVPAVRKEP